MGNNTIELTCIESNALSGIGKRKVSIEPSQIVVYEEMGENVLKEKTRVTTSVVQATYDSKDRAVAENIIYYVAEDYATVAALIKNSIG